MFCYCIAVYYLISFLFHSFFSFPIFIFHFSDPKSVFSVKPAIGEIPADSFALICVRFSPGENGMEKVRGQLIILKHDYSINWYDMIYNKFNIMVWSDVIWYDMIWYDMIYDTVNSMI